MPVSPSIFKAYDIRGLYPSEIHEDAARLIGRAFVSYLDLVSAFAGCQLQCLR